MTTDDHGTSAHRSFGSHTGPVVGLLFHRALAAIFLVAWMSLGSQIRLLVGTRGLLPLADFLAAMRAEDGLSLLSFPSLLLLAPDDGFLLWGCLGGVVLGVTGLAGWRPRGCAALQTVWYLGYVTACRGFLGFQWDNLLLECGLLASFLPADRPAPLAHLMFRALLFKLYFESGLAKWQSPLHDWRDGSAMTFYYETAPLPTALAWYAHHLPRGWHVFESHATLAIELVLPFAIFGPRRGRLVAAGLFTAFQIINAATANYGFFCYLTVALHLFLLDDRDVAARAARMSRAWLKLRKRPSDKASDPEATTSPATRPLAVPWSGRPVAAGLGAAAWVLVSLSEAWFHFGDPGPAGAAILPLMRWSQTLRVVNAYHLFAAVTRERVEPEVQLQLPTSPPDVWTPVHLRYKPGDPGQAPRFVAPHQPRVDFLLWFYGLGHQSGRQPIYVAELLGHLCADPAAVAPLFASALPEAIPTAVRMAFWDYRFTSPAERRATGAWWSRRFLGSTAAFPCGPSTTSTHARTNRQQGARALPGRASALCRARGPQARYGTSMRTAREFQTVAPNAESARRLRMSQAPRSRLLSIRAMTRPSEISERSPSKSANFRLTSASRFRRTCSSTFSRISL